MIALYPVSMCSKNMLDTLKLLVALFYFGSKPSNEENGKISEDLKAKELFPRKKPNTAYKGYSCEDLSLIVDRAIPAMVERAQ